MRLIIAILALAACRNGAEELAHYLDPDAHCTNVVTSNTESGDSALCRSGSDEWYCDSANCWVIGPPVQSLVCPRGSGSCRSVR